MPNAEPTRGSSEAGNAKLLAALVAPSGITPLALAALGFDEDAQESKEALGWGMAKRAAADFGINATSALMTGANMFGAGVDAIAGDESEQSPGRQIARRIRSGIEHHEEENPFTVAAGGAAVDTGLMMAPGAAGGLARGAVEGSEGLASALSGAAPSMGRRFAAQTATGGITGSATMAYDKAMESANRQALKDGHVDYEKALADGLDPATLLTGFGVGAGLSALGTGGSMALQEFGGKIGRALRGAGASQFMRESGMSGSAIRGAKKAAGEQSAEIVDGVLGDVAKKGSGISEVAGSKALAAEKEILQTAKDALAERQVSADALRAGSREAGEKLVAEARANLSLEANNANQLRARFAAPLEARLQQLTAEIAEPTLVAGGEITAVSPAQIKRVMQQRMEASAAEASAIQQQLKNLDTGINQMFKPRISAAAKELEARTAEAARLSGDGEKLAGDVIGGLDRHVSGDEFNPKNAAKLAELLKGTEHGDRVEQALARRDILNSIAKSGTDPDIMGQIGSFIRKKVMGRGVASLLGGGIGGLPGAAIGLGVESAMEHLVPNYASRSLLKVGGLAQSVGSTLSVDAAARGAVDSLFGSRLPVITSAAMAPGFLSSAKDKHGATARHVRQVSSIGPDQFEAMVRQSAGHLDPKGQAEASAHLGNVISNLKQRAPQPVIAPSPFGDPPMFSDTDIHNYEDYASVAASSAAYMKALRAHAVTPSMTESLRDNWPGVYQTMVGRFVEAAGEGHQFDTQAVRQMEMMMGDAILPEDRKDNNDFIQNFYDQDNRTNQPGSQGGGSQAASKNALSKGVKTPMESLSTAR